MADVGLRSDCVDLTKCCYCRGSLIEPVLLKCLHNCCRSCHESHAKQISQSTVKCIESCESTEADQVLTNCISAAYIHMSRIQSYEGCCTTCPGGEVTAVYWCTDCSRLFCETCYTNHNIFSLQCHRSAELEKARSWPLRWLIPAAQCSIHKQGIVAHCLTCRQPKCFVCYENCGTLQHDWRTLSRITTAEHERHVTEAITDAKQKLQNLPSGLSAKMRSRQAAVDEAYSNGHKELKNRKYVVKCSVVEEYRKAEREVLENQQWTFYKGTRIMARPQSMYETGATVASNTELLFLKAVNHLYLLRAKSLLMRAALAARSRISPLRASDRLKGVFVIHGSVPVTAFIPLSACLGTVDHRLASPPAPLLFGQASVSFLVQIECEDMALTKDGHTLLAARQHGLLEYSDRGDKLRGWQPTRRINGWDDGVNCLAVLNDGRVAVGVFYARLVALLRRRSETDDTWFEDSRVVELESPPWRLAVRDDLLAIADTEPGKQQLDWLPGRCVQLTRLSTGMLLVRQSRQYAIRSVALTSLCVVTAGNDRVKRSERCLVDAFSHAGGFLWHYETSDNELVMSVCSAEIWKHVYVALKKRDQNSSRVLAIGGTDGMLISDVLSSGTHELQAPALMSLSRGRQRTFLAAYSVDVTGLPTLTLYEARPSGETETM